MTAFCILHHPQTCRAWGSNKLLSILQPTSTKTPWHNVTQPFPIAGQPAFGTLVSNTMYPTGMEVTKTEVSSLPRSQRGFRATSLQTKQAGINFIQVMLHKQCPPPPTKKESVSWHKGLGIH